MEADANKGPLQIEHDLDQEKKQNTDSRRAEAKTNLDTGPLLQ
jgi:hypothetical protein